MKNKIMLICFAFLLILLAMPSVLAYKKLCLTEGQSVPLPPEEPSFTCSSTTCFICVKDNYHVAAPYKCNSIPFCEYLEDNGEPPVIDTEDPVITINSPVENAMYTSKRIDLGIGLNENAEISYMNILDSRIRWDRLCSNCANYDRVLSFDEGQNNISIRAADKNGNTAYKDIGFFIDSKKPKVHKVEPRNGYADGTFAIQYTEDNLDTINLTYTDGVITRYANLENCPDGKKQWCGVFVNLNEFDKKEINYFFTIKDDAGNIVDSRIIKKIKVDTTFPVINNINYTRDGKRITFVLNVTESNLDNIEYFDNDATRNARWRTLCSRLKNGICESRITLAELGEHHIDIQVIDEAGNMVGTNVVVSV